MRSPWGHRIVRGLVWASPAERPDLPKSRPWGTKALGLQYERRVAKALPRAKHGPWYEFRDEDGRGVCQPDLVLLLAKLVLVIECKLSDTLAGESQLKDLYLPVCALAHSRPAFGLVICKHVKPWSTQVCGSLEEALHALSGTSVPRLHWLGRGSI